MGLFDRFKQAVGFTEEARAQGKAADLEELVAKEPKNVEAWEQLASCYEKLHNVEELRRVYMKLCTLYQDKKSYDVAIGYLKQAEALFTSPYIPLLKKKVGLYIATGDLMDAYGAAQEVIKTHVAAGERNAALSFLRMLPSLGTSNGKWRKQLAKLIPGDEGKSQSMLMSTTTSSLPGFGMVWDPTAIDPYILKKPDAALATTSAEPVGQPPELQMMTPVVRTVLIFCRQNGLRTALAAQVREAGLHPVEVKTLAEAQSKSNEGNHALILADMPAKDWEWYTLFGQVRANYETHEIPFICVVEEGDSRAVVQALKMGVTDCWRWPLQPEEFRERLRFTAEHLVDERTSFSGVLFDLGLPDMLQMVEAGRMSGTLVVKNGQDRAMFFFDSGQLTDVQYGARTGEDAFYRVVHWNAGVFRFDNQPVDRTQNFRDTVQELLIEAMRRIDEQNKLVSLLPSAESVLTFTPLELSNTEVPAAFPRLQELFNGKNTLATVLDELGSDLDALELAVKCYQHGVLVCSPHGEVG